MKRSRLSVIVCLLACAAGVICGRAALHSVPLRDALGVVSGRGHLLALACGRGIYEADLERARAERRDAGDSRQSEQPLLLEGILSAQVAESLAGHEQTSNMEIAHELDLLRWQFPNEQTWRAALERSHLRGQRLRNELAAQLRARRWLLRQVPAPNSTAVECRKFYEAHPELFRQPDRYRASHLFLAAPPDTPPEIVDLKQKLIASLSERAHKREDFFELVAANSEDEATKARGGDLGFFSGARMPPDFFEAVRKLPVGEISQPIRTRLGFHIIRLTDVKPARQMGFEEAQPEIAAAFENANLAMALRGVSTQLLERAEFVRRSLR